MLAGRWISIVIANRWKRNQVRYGPSLEARVRYQVKYALTSFGMAQNRHTTRRAAALIAEFLDDRGHFERLVVTTRSFYEIIIKI